TTVSPTYAQEIQSTELGMGFQGVLLARANDFCGILNGIDETVWNPETDPLIAQPFHARSLAGKRVNRVAAQSAMKLDPDAVALRPASCSDRTAAKSSSGHSRAPSTSLPTAQNGSASSVQQ